MQTGTETRAGIETGTGTRRGTGTKTVSGRGKGARTITGCGTASGTASGADCQLSSSTAPSPAGGQQRHSKLYKQLDIAFD